MTHNGRSTLYGVLLGTVMAFTLSAVAHAEVREEFHHSYSLASNGRLSLSNINGNVVITAWDRNEVKVDAVKHASTQEKLNEAQIVVDSRSDSIDIQTKYPQRETNRNPASVEYTITVPRHVRVNDVKLVNGSLKLDGMDGEVSAKTVNGTVTATRLAGPVEVSTVNGAIDASLEKLSRHNIHLNSVNGSVTITIPSNADADVSATTMSGHIANDFGLPSKKQLVGHNLNGRLGRGGTQVSLNNVNGAIAIRHARDGKPLSKASGEGNDSTL